jgi:hypothetical protein
VALLLGALWYESGWLIRLVALAGMFELSFCEFALRRTRARVLRGRRSSIFVSRPASAGFCHCLLGPFLPGPQSYKDGRWRAARGCPALPWLAFYVVTGGPLSCSRSETVLCSWSLSTTSPSHIRKSQNPHASQERSMGHPAQVPTSRSGLSEVLLLLGPHHWNRLA